MSQVKIGHEFFEKIKLDYADWKWALVREFLQNCFDAPGSRNVGVGILAAGNTTVMEVLNDGAPMDRATLEGKLLTLGGSGKNFQGENTGGFGVAKSLLYYCHLNYSIHTGNLMVAGSGAGYEIGEAEHLEGTRSVITLDGAHSERLADMVRRFARMAQWRGTLTLNGEVLATDLHKGARRKDLGWGVVYTNKSFENTYIVRLNGQPMFSGYTSFKGCVLVELNGKACDTLTSNRDALKGQYRNEFTTLLTALAIDKRSALREQKAEYRRYKGELQKAEAKKPKAAEDGLAAIGIAADLQKIFTPGPHIRTPDGVTPAENHGQADPTPSTEQPGGSIKVTVLSRQDEPDSTISVGPQFILKNSTGMKVPVWYTPGEKFSAYSRELVLAWTAVLLKLHQIAERAGEFSVGFSFDEETEAESEKGVYGQVYYLNPAKLLEENGKRRFEQRYTSAWSDRFALVSLAAHEFVHGAYGLAQHDEDYAGTLTDVMILVLKHQSELMELCRPPKTPVAGEGKPSYDSFHTHSVTSVIRWMGKEYYTFERARTTLDNLGFEQVADGTIRTMLYAGRKNERGGAAELTPEQAQEVWEAGY